MSQRRGTSKAFLRHNLWCIVNERYIVLFSPDFKYKVDSFNLYIQTIMLKGLLGGVYHELKTLKTINKVH